MRKVIQSVLSVISGIAITCSVPASGQSNELSVRSVLSLPILFAETIVATNYLVLKGKGNSEAATCVVDYYFQNPLGTRLIVEGVWKNSENNAAIVLTKKFEQICGDGGNPPAAPMNLWPIANNDHDQINQEDSEAALAYAALLTLGVSALVDDGVAKDVSTCIFTLMGDDNYYSNQPVVPQNGAVVLIAIDAYNAASRACNYPTSIATSSFDEAPVISNIVDAAGERLLALHEILECEEMSDGADKFNSCVNLRFKERENATLGVALATIEQNIEKSENELADMRKAAWRLPDGRLIFESSKDRNWYFEDGEVVPPHLVATKVPPK